MVIRNPYLHEHEEIHRLIKSVITEIYGGLWSESPIEVDNQDWSKSWIARSGGEVVGVLLTTDGWIDDLWIRHDHRGQGLGAKLLRLGEEEIAGRHYAISRLRVGKVNRNAISFYISHGWKIEKEFRHESLPIEMLELAKRVDHHSV